MQNLKSQSKSIHLSEFQTTDIDTVLEMIGSQVSTPVLFSDNNGEYCVVDSETFIGQGKYQTAKLVVMDNHGRYYLGKINKTNSGCWQDTEFDDSVTFVQVKPKLIQKYNWIVLKPEDTDYEVKL